MRSEPSDLDTKPAADARGLRKNSGSSISEFLSRIFEQLSLSAWLPATMLIGNVAVLLQLHANHNFNISLAVRDLAIKPLGTIVILIFAVILATMVTQAFEFEVIRLLEGYFDSTRGWVQTLIAIRIRRHAGKRRKLEAKLQRMELAAFRLVRPLMEALPGYNSAVLDCIEGRIYGQTHQSASDDAAARTAAETDWKQHLPPEYLYVIDSLEARLNSYPQTNRLLPTRLGNVLRAAEDELQLEATENLEGFVIRHYDEISPSLKNEHDDYRTRLEMYCCLVLVFSALTAISVVSLIPLAPVWGTAIAAAVYGMMAYVSYAAAIASARGYGEILQEIAQYINRRDESVEEGPLSTLARLRAFLHRNPM